MDNTRIALIVFSEQVRLEFELDRFVDNLILHLPT